jgi:hypothetical protein
MQELRAFVLDMGDCVTQFVVAELAHWGFLQPDTQSGTQAQPLAEFGRMDAR